MCVYVVQSSCWLVCPFGVNEDNPRVFRMSGVGNLATISQRAHSAEPVIAVDRGECIGAVWWPALIAVIFPMSCPGLPHIRLRCFHHRRLKPGEAPALPRGFAWLSKSGGGLGADCCLGLAGGDGGTWAAVPRCPALRDVVSDRFNVASALLRSSAALGGCIRCGILVAGLLEGSLTSIGGEIANNDAFGFGPAAAIQYVFRRLCCCVSSAVRLLDERKLRLNG